MAVQSINVFTILISFFIAAFLELVTLPDILAFLRPEWLVLTLIYWLLRYPSKIGMGVAVSVGLVMDVMVGTYLGIHVLATSIICYLVLTMHQRLKMFPIVQQAIVVFFITGIQLMVVYILRSQLSVVDSGLNYLWQALTSAILWPFVVVLYDRLVFALR